MFRARVRPHQAADIREFQFPLLEETEAPQRIQAAQVTAGDSEPDVSLPSELSPESELPSELVISQEPELSSELELQQELELSPESEFPPELVISLEPELPSELELQQEPELPPEPSISLSDIEKEAYEKGLEKGLEEGLEEGRRAGAESVEKEAAELLSGLRAAVAGVREMREQVVREVEPQVVELAIAIARRILVGELSENPERVVDIVKEALRRIERVGAVKIRVHPDLSDVMSSLKGRSSEFQTDILLDIDPSVPPYGPVVVGATEEVLTDIDEQLRVIEEELRSERAAN